MRPEDRPERALRKAMACLVLGSALAGGQAEAATFTVRNNNDAGVNSLRAAITAANLTAALDTIDFAILPAGPYTITLASPLPPITQPVIIDGTTQGGWVNAAPFAPVIQLNGATAGAGTYGLDLQAGSSGTTIRGLCINRFSARAIRIQESSNNVIAGNFLGTNLAGTAAGPGNSSGIFIGGGALPTNNNTIGGAAAADRNLISGNAVDGIQMNGGAGGASNNVVQGNYIGVDVTGNVDLGNASQGVAIYNTTTPGPGPNTNNVVRGNVISGNGGDGIRILEPGTTGTVVQGNTIGIGADGSTSIPNGAGVRLDTGTQNNTIGGTTAAEGNVIAFNNPLNTFGLGGIYFTPSAGSGNAILGNRIYSNVGLGIDLNEDRVTLNDGPTDPDGGPNGRLNFPVIASARHSAGSLTVNYRLELPAGNYRIEFFKSPSGADTTPPTTGYGEGEVFATSASVNHLGGSVFYNVSFPGSAGDIITATTTGCNNAACALAPSPAFGSTSEFSRSMQAVTTAVTLMSFEARGSDRAVDLSWATASELQNLGFHLYRALSADGPFARINAAVIPGLGSSAIGQGYGYRDEGLTNGVTYFYKLEDIDTSGVSTLHGPVSAAPSAASKGVGTPHGDPAATSLNILERDSQHVLLELRTGGFYTTPNSDGSVEVTIPGFDERSSPGDPALPSRHTWIEAIAGKKVQITSVQASDLVSFPGLRPSPAAVLGMDVTRAGIVRPDRSPRHESATFRRGLFPRMIARVLRIGFQEETKKAELELAPLRFNALSGTLLLSRRLLVRLDFVGVDPGDVPLGGSRGRRPIAPRPRPQVAAQLVVHEKGLHGVSFADLFGRSGAAVPVSSLLLTHQGQPVAFHVDRSTFGPGANLYFRSDEATLEGDAREAVYELTRKRGGRRMTTASAAPYGAGTPHYLQRVDLEQNKTYQSGLLDAPDLWLWDVLVSPVTRTYPFTLDQLASTSESAHLTVWLQGASDFDLSPDHHLRVSVNGTPLAEVSWDGKTPRTIEADVTPGVLVEGQNELAIENVGDTPAAYSMVMLNRFALSYPRLPFAVNGILEGTVSQAGTVEVSGLGPGSLLLDTTEAEPRWLTGLGLGTSGLRFRAEAGRRYLAVAPTALLRPEVRRPAPGQLRNVRNRADYLLIGPRAFLAAVQPLLALRQRQGLRARAVAVEDVYDQFGFGEARPEAIQAFLAYAYHHWQRPSVRYVLLLGDATYDPNDYLQTGIVNRVPAWMARTSYLWTASDPAYAAVNGDDSLPDLALGRLPAGTVEEARLMVDKIVAFESSGRDLSGPAVMVADNADAAGDFEQDADDVAATVLPGRALEKVYLRDLGAATRSAIQSAFDNGPSLVSYIGHGGIAVWASENIWNNLDVDTLAPQERLPLLFTMNCLNGYFHFPNLNSLAEQFLKAEGKGAIAAFAPSGLSLDAPAHAYHKLVLAEITSGAHPRLGDAVLAAQNAYAASGDFPELLSIYHLFGDPAQTIR